MSEGMEWWQRPCDRLDDYDAAVARREAGLSATLADACRPRCVTCRGDLEPAQYGTAGRDWCPKCEPHCAPPPVLCTYCPAVATWWSYTPARGVPYCAEHGPQVVAS